MQPESHPAKLKTPHVRFEDGLRAIFSTSKEQSDAQLKAAAEKRKKRKQSNKTDEGQP